MCSLGVCMHCTEGTRECASPLLSLIRESEVLTKQMELPYYNTQNVVALPGLICSQIYDYDPPDAVSIFMSLGSQSMVSFACLGANLANKYIKLLKHKKAICQAIYIMYINFELCKSYSQVIK